MIKNGKAIKEKNFVFLEITDPDVNALFSAFSKVINGAPIDKAPHLTIRGPYSERIPSIKLKEWREIIKLDVLSFGNAGIFSNQEEFVVYLSVNSPNLRKIWHKPDYPISKYGFNPHISIYRGSNEQFAASLYEFFDKENLELFCAEFRIVEYVSRLIKLFSDEFPLAEYPQRLTINGRMKTDFIERLIAVVGEIKPRNKKA